MDKLRISLLMGLYTFGRKKTFTQILDAVHQKYSSAELVEAANALESLGLIKSVTYQLPVEIRAELTSYGKEYLQKLNGEISREGHFRPNKP